MIYLYSQTPYFHENIIHESLSEIRFLKFKKPNFSKYQAIIFSSKNGVKSVAKFFHEWRNLEIFAIGEATKSEILKLGFTKVFVSQSAYGDEFAKQISHLLQNKKTLVIRAKKVISNIDEILQQKGAKVKSIKTYKNSCKKLKNFTKPHKNSTLIFTAPSIVKCFLKKFKLKKSYKIICIGKKTALSLPKNRNFQIPNQQSIEECVKLALSLNR